MKKNRLFKESGSRTEQISRDSKHLFGLMGFNSTAKNSQAYKELHTALDSNKYRASLSDVEKYLDKLLKRLPPKYTEKQISKLRSNLHREQRKPHLINDIDKFKHINETLIDFLTRFKADTKLNVGLKQLTEISKRPLESEYDILNPFSFRKIKYENVNANLVALNERKPIVANHIKGYIQPIFPNKIVRGTQSNLGYRDNDPFIAMDKDAFNTIPGIFYPNERSPRAMIEIKKLLSLYAILTDFSVPIKIIIGEIMNPNKFDMTIQYIAQIHIDNLDYSGKALPFVRNSGRSTRMLRESTINKTVTKINRCLTSGYTMKIHGVPTRNFQFAPNAEQVLNEAKGVFLERFNINYQLFREQLLETINVVHKETVMQMRSRGERVDENLIFNTIVVTYLPWLTFVLERFDNSVLKLGVKK